MTITFRIYYKGGMTYEGAPENAPIFDVLVIVEKDANHGKRLVTHGDYFCWEDNRWRPYDYPGLIQYLKNPGWKRVLLGVMADEKEWTETYKRALNDANFPVKTAYDMYEVKV